MPKKVTRPIVMKTIYLYEDQIFPLSLYAMETGQNVSEVIRELVDDHLAKVSKKNPRK